MTPHPDGPPVPKPSRPPAAPSDVSNPNQPNHLPEDHMITHLTPGTYRVTRAEYDDGTKSGIHRVGDLVTITEDTQRDYDIRVLNRRTGQHGWIGGRNLLPVEITGLPLYIQVGDRVSDLSSLPAGVRVQSIDGAMAVLQEPYTHDDPFLTIKWEGDDDSTGGCSPYNFIVAPPATNPAVSALEELLAQAEADQETAHAVYSAAATARAEAVEKTDALSAALRTLKKYL